MIENAVYEKLSKLEWLLKRKHMLEAEDDHFRFDPARGQGRVIAALRMKDGISTKDLSFVLGISVPTLNEMLAKLSRAGYVERRSSAEDKRIILNYLTEEGKNRYEQDEQQDDIDFLACLSEEEQRILEGYLDRMIACLEEAMEDRFEDFDEHMRTVERERDRIFSGSHMKGRFPKKHPGRNRNGRPDPKFGPAFDEGPERPPFRGECPDPEDFDSEERRPPKKKRGLFRDKD